jgi:hypothetical protein
MRNIIDRPGVAKRLTFARGAASLFITLSVFACRTDAPTAPELQSPTGSAAAVISGAPTEGGACPACVFGPRVYTRKTAQPVTDVATFAGNPAGAYIIEIDDHGSQGANATIVLNGRALNARAGYSRGPVSLQAVNRMETRLTGKPGSKLEVSIFQEVHSVTVTPNLNLTRIPATQQFTAVARDANGVVIPNQTFEWASSDLTIGTIAVNSGLARTTGSVQNTLGWNYKTITTGEGTTVIAARAIATQVRGSVPWRVSGGFVYTTFQAPLPTNSPNRANRPTPEPHRYDQARLQTMTNRCGIERGNESWQDYVVLGVSMGERLFFQCFTTLALTTTRVRTVLGVDIYDEVANVGVYGRYCGEGHPGEEFYHNFANSSSGNYQPRDPIDAICMEHDAQELNHELSTSSVSESILALCIVRYGIESETLHKDGVPVQRGSDDWNAFWIARLPMAVARQHFLTLSQTACPDGDITVGGVTVHGVYQSFRLARGLSIM